MTVTKGPAPADPVRGLLRQHRELCEHAVDPLEIAAGLEARGVTDRTAARFRHRDVFSLAEELYARAPHPGTEYGPSAVSLVSRPGGNDGTADTAADTAPALAGLVAPAPAHPAPKAPAGVRARGVARAALWPLLPGALCGGVLAGPALLEGAAPLWRTAAATGGALLVLAGVAVGVRPALRGARVPAGLAVWACWLVGYALVGDWLLSELLAGGPEFPGPGPVELPPGVAPGLALAVAPAVWCARGFARGARRRLAGSRSLEEFAGGVRPLLVAVVVAFLVCLGALLWVAAAAPFPHPAHGSAAHPADSAVDSARGAVAPLGQGTSLGVLALGALLFTALLLAAHGFGGAAAAGLGAACALEALALLSVLAARLPGVAAAGRPVELSVALLGTAAVPVLACGCAALALFFHASRALTGASAHHRAAAPT